MQLEPSGGEPDSSSRETPSAPASAGRASATAAAGSAAGAEPIGEEATRLERALLWSALAAWAAMLLLSAWVLPFYKHDELAFSEWSRLIAQDGGFFFPSTTLLTYQRPLLYVGQGWLWLVAGHSETLARLLHGSFVALLLFALFRLVDRLAGRRQATLAVLVMLNLRGLQEGGSLAMTDIPVAALTGAAGALVLGVRGGTLRSLALVAVAAAAVLAKPSSAFAFLGLLPALWLVDRAAGWAHLLCSTAAIATGFALAAGYHLWLLGGLDLPPQAAVTSASVELPHYLAIAARMRLGRLISLGWLSPDTGVTALLAFTVALVLCGGRPSASRASVSRAAIALGALLAIVGAASAILAYGSTPRRLIASFALLLAAIGWLAPGLAATPRAPLPRRVELGLALWALAPLGAWLGAAPYVVRLLSPAWVPLVALTAGTMVAASRGFEARGGRLLAALGPLALWLGALHAAANLVDVRPPQWSALLARAGSDQAAVSARREIVLGPFARALDATAAEIGETGSVLSPSGEFRYFFPGRALQSYPRSCADLAVADVFVLPTYESVRSYFREALRVSPEPAFWEACAGPRLERLWANDTYVVYRVRR